jgi:succinate dehydrogenase hydrophobic anchor subunit
MNQNSIDEKSINTSSEKPTTSTKDIIVIIFSCFALMFLLVGLVFWILDDLLLLPQLIGPRFAKIFYQIMIIISLIFSFWLGVRLAKDYIKKEKILKISFLTGLLLPAGMFIGVLFGDLPPEMRVLDIVGLFTICFIVPFALTYFWCKKLIK